jgi:hypothetical protein
MTPNVLTSSAPKDFLHFSERWKISKVRQLVTRVLNSFRRAVLQMAIPSFSKYLSFSLVFPVITLVLKEYLLR